MSLSGRARGSGRWTVVGLAIICVPLLAPTAGRAQMPFTAVGLGYPIRSIDARSVALGGVTNGLLGGTFSLGNPADLTLQPSAGVAVAIAGENINLKAQAGEVSTGRSWFPVIDAVVPLGAWAFRLGFGGLLDQDLRVLVTDTLATSIGRFEYEELRTRDGGVSQIDVAVARKLGPASIGVGIQRLTGSLQQSLRRRFIADIDSVGILPAGVFEGEETDFSGWSVKAGANAEFADRFVISGSFFFATDLTAKQLETMIERTLRLPNGFEGGISGRITSRLLLSAGGGWSGWSATDQPSEAFTVADASWLGGGLEYTAFLGTLPLMLRVGGRTRDLPFVLPDHEQPTETAATLGFGTLLGGRVRVDLGFELGSRGELDRTGTEEQFTSLYFTAAILQ